MTKAGERGADVVVLDLEDGVHPDLKLTARAQVQSALARLSFGSSEVLVRANALDTPWGAEDVAMIAEARPRGAVLPKCESPSVVHEVAVRLAPNVPLFLMIETATGVLRAPELARVDNVRGLFFGAADFREDIRASATPDETEILHARSHVVLAARAAGIDALDTPWFVYKDLEGLRASAERARKLGFDGKTAIHPSQLEVIHEVFTPSEAEIARARRIVSVMEGAASEGRNVATLDDEMVEALHLKGARRVLRQAGV